MNAPVSDFYIQFEPRRDTVVGEAVGESNLPNLTAYHIAPRLREKLPGLGWTQPGSSGNWTRVWRAEDWRPHEVAQLVIDTMQQAYGFDPATLTVSTATF